MIIRQICVPLICKQMKILQIGVPKSGNFWLYKIVQSVMTHAGLAQDSFIQNHPIHPLAQAWPLSHSEQANIDVLDIERHRCFYRVSSVFRMPIVDIDAYLAACSHVWSHSAYNPRSERVLPKFDKVVYIVRDPRDHAISMARFAFTPYMQLVSPHDAADRKLYLRQRLPMMIRDWVGHVGGYLPHVQRLNMHLVFYERLIHAFDSEMAALLRYLELEPSPALVAQIKRDVAFDTMQQQHPDHVRKGQAGQWRQRLSAKQKRQAVWLAKPLLTLLGYSETAVSPTNLPALPADLSPALVQQTVRQSRRRAYLVRLFNWLNRQESP